MKWYVQGLVFDTSVPPKELGGKVVVWRGQTAVRDAPLDGFRRSIELALGSIELSSSWSFGANWNIAYHWRLVEEGKTLSAPLPLTSSWKLWIIELAFVWRWFHVIRTSGSEDTTILVGLDPPARPASFQLDRAAFPGVKVKPEKCCFPLTPL
ncbi:unnamed protein product [Microthlaspi erraticum]|uniref:Uncharacterized protein n=1 Tax=Microthlaspi erraticum TaxID=1685480 RepID=A0A6D2II16_9BRAS|nr:unnamed protein product [Microthlaspi erraticum]